MSNARELSELAGSYGTGGFVGMKNRIINGGMVIDQRNAGASVSVTTAGAYGVDRWVGEATVSNKFSVQQNAGAVTPPVGFKNYLGVTSSAATSLSASDFYMLSQMIEGYNVSDLGWGTANAQTVTLSFWVRSSLTGTFGGVASNAAQNRSYPFTFTISSANTWEQKTITVAGDTSGTWATDNSQGLRIRFGLGVGSTYSNTAGAWAAGTYFAPTGATSVVGTSGATFYITGVQLEKGSTATSFDYRTYGTELMLCQRYYYRTVAGAAGSSQAFCLGIAFSSTTAGLFLPFPVTMRTAPSALEQNGTAANYILLSSVGGTIACSSVPTFNSATTQSLAWFNFTVASGLVGGNGTAGFGLATTSAYLGWSAEL